MNKLFALIASIAGYGIFAWFFSTSLINPSENLNFINKMIMTIFLIEFLSVHSGFMVGPFSAKAKRKAIKLLILLFGVYSLFAVTFALVQNSIYPILIFLLSLFAKFFWSRVSASIIMAAMSVFLYITTIFAAIFLEPFLIKTFPFPTNLITQDTGDVSIQVMVAWGVMYYSLLILAEILYYLISKKFPKMDSLFSNISF